ncbi:MAG: hypothetical protein ABIG43_01135, partial [Chloroflexota bacterium]
NYRVHTGPAGFLSGYAWNDNIGWIALYGPWQEMPPATLRGEISIIAEPTGVESMDVDSLAEAPLADGGQSYRISLKLWDTDEGRYLDSSDLISVEFDSPETDPETLMWLNQVDEVGDPILISPINANFSGCETLGSLGAFLSCIDDSGPNENFNTFVYSGAPTSNMTGLDADKNGNLDGEVSFRTDRAGCVGFYYEQPNNPACDIGPNGSVWGFYYNEWYGDDIRTRVFQHRSASRNQYILSKIQFEVVHSNSTREIVFTQGGGWKNVGGGFASYEPTWSEGNLKFKPRYLAKDFYAEYPAGGGDRYIRVQDPSIPDGYSMDLVIVGERQPLSAEYMANYHMPPGATLSLTSYVQVDEISSGGGSAPRRYLLIDDNTPLVGDVIGAWSPFRAGHTRGDLIEGQPVAYSITIPMGYEKYCDGGDEPPCADPSSNTIWEPVAEHWVCDPMTIPMFGDESCYFTGYLPRADRYLDPENALVLGAINSTISLDETLTNSEDASVIGSKNYTDARNQIYKTVSRLTLGQEPNGITAELNSNMAPNNPYAGRVLTLMGGQLLYAKGNVNINGSDSFSEKTLVVNGGDVFIWGNITGTKLGIIVLERNGVGGNLYIRPEVTDIWANIFLDGSVYSYKGTSDDKDPVTGYPIWDSVGERWELMKSQLYIYGSIVARNTLGGASDDTAGSWSLGDGTTTTNYVIAKDHDLNKLREFRLCLGMLPGGIINWDDDDPEDCGEGELRSSYLLPDGSQSNAPLIIENSPPSSTLPVFNQSGLKLSTQ